MATMRAAQISKPNAAFEIVERSIPEPRWAGSHQGAGVRNLPQRCDREARPVS